MANRREAAKTSVIYIPRVRTTTSVRVRYRRRGPGRTWKGVRAPVAQPRPATRYDCFMGQDRDLDGFPTYLRRAITDAGFDTPTQFARTARIEPSVVFAWLRGERRPTMRLIERFAPVLNLEIRTVASEAYPEAASRARQNTPAQPKLVRQAADVQLALGPDSPLTEDERQRVIVFVEAGIGPVRAKLRRRRAS